MFDDSVEKMRATRVYLTFSLLFFAVAIGTGFVMAADRGYGAGPWNSHTVWSCGARGGPYYLRDRPRSQQPCPSPYEIDGKARGLKADAPPHPR